MSEAEGAGGWTYYPPLAGMTLVEAGEGFIVHLEYPPDEFARLDGRRDHLRLIVTAGQLREIGQAFVRAADHVSAPPVPPLPC